MGGAAASSASGAITACLSCSDICNGNHAFLVQQEVTGSGGDQASGLINTIYMKARSNVWWESACSPPPMPRRPWYNNTGGFLTANA